MLHNFIRTEKPLDDMEMETDIDNNSEIIDTIKLSNKWTIQRQNLAEEMWNTWNASRQESRVCVGTYGIWVA